MPTPILNQIQSLTATEDSCNFKCPADVTPLLCNVLVTCGSVAIKWQVTISEWLLKHFETVKKALVEIEA